MKRKTYKEAIQWIVDNDDTEWVHDDDPIPCVTASMVADLYNVPIEQVVRAITKEIKKGF